MSWRVSHRQLAVLALPVVLSVALSGCGGGAATDASATPTTLAVPTLSTPPTPKLVTPTAGTPGAAVAAPTSSSAAAAATTVRPSSATSPPASSGADAKVYVVGEGDTLAVVANKVYGDSSLWQKIYEANKDVIGENPDHIQIGMKLKIPPKS